MPPELLEQHILTFIASALNDGWTVRKSGSSYVFSKPHEGKKQVLTNEYLTAFVEKHLSCAANIGVSPY